MSVLSKAKWLGKWTIVSFVGMIVLSLVLGTLLGWDDGGEQPEVEATEMPTEEPSPTETEEDSQQAKNLSSAERFDLYDKKRSSLGNSEHVADVIGLNANGIGDEKKFTYYSLTKTNSSTTEQAIAVTATNYASIVEQDTFGTHATVDVYDEDSNFVGRVTIDRQLAEQYNDGELTKKEYIEKVMETLTDEKQA